MEMPIKKAVNTELVCSSGDLADMLHRGYPVDVATDVEAGGPVVVWDETLA